MRLAKIFFALALVLVCAMRCHLAAQTSPSSQRIVIAASRVLDGKGHVLEDRRIVVEGSKIVAVEPLGNGPVDYNLRRLTVLPGWIDAHVHITWIFGKDGKNAGTEGTSQEDAYKATPRGNCYLKRKSRHRPGRAGYYERLLHVPTRLSGWNSSLPKPWRAATKA
jgi:hypothetical protein